MEDLIKELEQAREKGMNQGVALAIALMLRNEDETSIWKACGMSIQECIESEVDIFDMEKLIPEFATIDDTELVAGYYIKTLPNSDERRMNAEKFITAMNTEIMDDLKGVELHDQLLYRKQQYLDILKDSK